MPEQISKYLSSFLFLTLIGLTTSCAELSESEQIDDVVFSANNMLSYGKCQDAIDLLEGIGRKNDHASYLMTLSSAYACRSGFDEPTFYADNLPNLGTTVGTTFWGSFTQFASSIMIGPNDDSFADLQEAIDILLYAGGINNPSHANRSDKFNDTDANDMNMQLLYMILTHMGKYSFYYGNANPTNGTKGNGSLANGNANNNDNECFIIYRQDDIDTTVQAYGGACTNDTGGGENGHPQLDPTAVGATTFVQRACQGLVLFNNFLDVLTNVTLSSSLGDLGTLQGNASLNTICSAPLIALGADGSLLCETRSQSQCESNWANDTSGNTALTTGTNALEMYLGIIWEGLFQN
jgi:hypothetical protein